MRASGAHVATSWSAENHHAINRVDRARSRLRYRPVPRSSSRAGFRDQDPMRIHGGSPAVLSEISIYALRDERANAVLLRLERLGVVGCSVPV